MTAVAEADPFARVARLLRLVQMQADAHARRGLPGAWRDVARRAALAQASLTAAPTCQARGHLYRLELDIWGQLLADVVRPERKPDLVEALRARANGGESGDPVAFELALGQLLRALGDSAGGASVAVDIDRGELDVIRAIRAFRARPTVSALRACLAGATDLAAIVQAHVHPPCGPELHVVGDVLTQVLVDLFALGDRFGLARNAEGRLFDRYGEPGELRASAGGVPRALWRRLPKGEVIAPVHTRVVLVSDANVTPPEQWMIDPIEAVLEPYRAWTYGELMGWDERVAT